MGDNGRAEQGTVAKGKPAWAHRPTRMLSCLEGSAGVPTRLAELMAAACLCSFTQRPIVHGQRVGLRHGFSFVMRLANQSDVHPSLQNAAGAMKAFCNWASPPCALLRGCTEAFCKPVSWQHG